MSEHAESERNLAPCKHGIAVSKTCPTCDPLEVEIAALKAQIVAKELEAAKADSWRQAANSYKRERDEARSDLAAAREEVDRRQHFWEGIRDARVQAAEERAARAEAARDYESEARDWANSCCAESPCPTPCCNEDGTTCRKCLRAEADALRGAASELCVRVADLEGQTISYSLAVPLGRALQACRAALAGGKP
jgi:hypothetical protein